MRTYTRLHHVELARPQTEMKTPKQLPADFRDWVMARTFEIGAEMALPPAHAEARYRREQIFLDSPSRRYLEGSQSRK